MTNQQPAQPPRLERRALVPGRSLRLVFQDGKAMNVVLVEFDWHSLIVDTTDESQAKRLLVFKHALKYVMLGNVTPKE
jgi:hypothetical protein